MSSYAIFQLIFLIGISSTLVYSQETYTNAELAALKKFRPMAAKFTYEDYMLTDDYLIPWLRARKLDLNRAKEMLEKNIKWRLENNIDNIKNEELSAAEKCIKVFHGGVDRQGRPLVYANLGAWDIRKCALGGLIPVMQRYIIRHYLEGPARVARELQLKEPGTGKNVTHFTSIMDMSGFNLRQGACLACLPFFGTWAYNIESYYPASAHRYFLPNMPQVFEVVIDFVKPIMTPPTSNAIVKLSFNKDEWLKQIEKVVDNGQIPAIYGGKRKETAADRALY